MGRKVKEIPITDSRPDPAGQFTVTSHKSQVTSHKSQVTSHKSQVTSQSQVSSHKLQGGTREAGIPWGTSGAGIPWGTPEAGERGADSWLTDDVGRRDLDLAHLDEGRDARHDGGGRDEVCGGRSRGQGARGRGQRTGAQGEEGRGRIGLGFKPVPLYRGFTLTICI